MLPWQLSLVNNKFLLFKFIISHWFISWAKPGRSASTVLYNNWKSLSKGWNKHYFYLVLLNQTLIIPYENFQWESFFLLLPPILQLPLESHEKCWDFYNSKFALDITVIKRFNSKMLQALILKKTTPLCNLTPYQSIHFILWT